VRYRAPALEKGLDVLELLAASPHALSTTLIGRHLGRSRSEIFRMLSVLEDRGFIGRDEAAEGFALTPKLLELAMQNPPTADLVGASLPVMESLAEATSQSCHLAVATAGEMVVIARVESPDEVGFAVRIGHRRPLAESTSGRVLLAFQPDERRAAWLKATPRRSRVDRHELARDLARIRRLGHRRARSSFVEGIVDLGCPVFDGVSAGAAAALTIPYVKRRSARHSVAEVTSLLKEAAVEIGRTLRSRAGAPAARSADA